MLNGDISWVRSDLDDFRFVAGPGVPTLENTYLANVSSGATSVSFELGGQSITDANAADGWSATFDMSASNSDTDLTVRSFDGGTLLDTYTHDIELLLLPNWMQEPNVAINSITADPTTGYAFEIYAQDVNFEVFTPSDWSWGLQYFNEPVIDLADLRTGFDSGWQLNIQSTSYGGVFVTDSSYQLNLEILGETIWSPSIETGTSGTLDGLFNAKNKSSEKPQAVDVTGNYSVALSPQLTDTLQWADGLSGSAHVDVNLSKSIHLPPLSLANSVGLPSWIVDIQAKPFLEIGAGLSIDTNLGFDSTGIHLNTLNVTPSILVGLGVSGEANAGGGRVAKAGITVTGTLEQNLSMTYLPSSGWSYNCPGSLILDGSLYWDTLLTHPGGKDLFHIDVADWDFCDLGSTPPIESTGTQPYDAPVVENDDPSSSDPQTPTLRPSTFTVDITSLSSDIGRYGVLIAKPVSGGNWRTVYVNYDYDRSIDIGPLPNGSYRLQTVAVNEIGGWGYGEEEFFWVDEGPRPGNDLSLIDVEIYETPGGVGSDGDYYPEAGESVRIDHRIRNTSADDIYNISGILSSPTGLINVTDNDNWLVQGTLGPGDSSWQADDFNGRFTFNEHHSDFPFTLYVEYTKGGVNYYQEFEWDRTIYAEGEREADFEVVGVVIDDSPAHDAKNNGDGVIQSWEEIYFYPIIKNTGGYDVLQNVEVTVLPTSGSVHINSDQIHYPDIQRGHSESPTYGDDFFRADIASDFVGQWPVSLHIEWANGNRSFELNQAMTLDVYPEAWGYLSEDYFYFGQVSPGDPVNGLLTIENYGSESLRISGFEITDEYGHAVGDTTLEVGSVTVPVGESVDVRYVIDSTGLDGPLTRTIRCIADNGRFRLPEHAVMTVSGYVGEGVPLFSVPDSAGVGEVDTDGNWVVWNQNRFGSSDIFAYNMSTGEERQITSAPTGEGRPRIGNGIIAWEDGRNAAATGIDIYAYDMATGLEFVVSDAPYDERLVGADGKSIAFTRVYAELTSPVDTTKYAADLYLYDAGTQTEDRITNFAATATATSKWTADYFDADFGNAYLVWNQNRRWWDASKGRWRVDSREATLKKVNEGGGFVQLFNDYAADLRTDGESVVWITEDDNNDNQIVRWRNGSTSQVTASDDTNDKVNYGRLAIGYGFIVHDNDIQAGSVFYVNTASGFNDELLYAGDELYRPNGLRMSDNVVVWYGESIVFAALHHPDVSVASTVLSDDRPLEGTRIDVSVVVENESDYLMPDAITVQLYDGDPDDGGTQLGADEAIPGGLAAQGQTTVVFADIAVPQNLGPDNLETHQLYVRVVTPSFDNPANNTGRTELNVRDSDTDGPSIFNVAVAEQNGDGDGIIGADESAFFSWTIADASGVDLSSVELLIDGEPVLVTDEGGGNFSAGADALSSGEHVYVIRASDLDPGSPSGSTVQGVFDVVVPESISVELLGPPSVPIAPGNSVDIGTTTNASLTVRLRNIGEQTLSIHDVAIENLRGQVSLDAAPPSTVSFGGAPEDFSLILNAGNVGPFEATISIDNSSSEAPFAFTIVGELANSIAEVSNRRAFYNNSSFDVAGDDMAIASDKEALLPGGTATFANYTSYSRGLNGLMVDVSDIQGAPALSDFEFRVGNSNNPSGWLQAPAPTMNVVLDGGGLGVERIVLTWADNEIENTWLEVTVLSDANGGGMGLAQDEVFYFGNAIGETGNDSGDARVNPQDIVLTRNNQTGFGTAAIDNAYDFDRDGRVNPQDIVLVRNNQSGFTPLQLIQPPLSATFAAGTVDASASAMPIATDAPFDSFDSELSGRPVLIPLSSESTVSAAVAVRRLPAARQRIDSAPAAMDEAMANYESPYARHAWRRLSTGPRHLIAASEAVRDQALDDLDQAIAHEFSREWGDALHDKTRSLRGRARGIQTGARA